MTMLQRIARSFGYDLLPRKKAKIPSTQLVSLLDHHRIDTILDVGANVGQYGKRLRSSGYKGRIISFEPLAEAHAELCRAAAGDSSWEVAPPMAIGDANSEVTIERSAESDMSSILSQNALLRQISPSSKVSGREQVAMHRLDRIVADFVRPTDRVLLKIDTQGFESQVLDGASGVLPRIHAIQLELSLLPLYEGAIGFQAMLARLEAGGFDLHLVLPGYFERKLARHLEIDGVFVRSTGGL